MPVQPITSGAIGLDLSPRVVDSIAIVASPALAAETIIASVAIPNFGAVNGTVVADTGALTGGVAAAAKIAQDVAGSDATPGVGTYVLTLQVTAGAAVSTVSAVQLLATIV